MQTETEKLRETHVLTCKYNPKMLITRSMPTRRKSLGKNYRNLQYFPIVTGLMT